MPQVRTCNISRHHFPSFEGTCIDRPRIHLNTTCERKRGPIQYQMELLPQELFQARRRASSLLQLRPFIPSSSTSMENDQFKKMQICCTLNKILRTHHLDRKTSIIPRCFVRNPWVFRGQNRCCQSAAAKALEQCCPPPSSPAALEPKAIQLKTWPPCS